MVLYYDHMKNYTALKVFIAIFAGFVALAAALPAEAAYYYDQTGRAIYYDTYTVPGGQYYPAAPQYNYGYSSNNGYSYGYNNGYPASYAYAPSNRPPVFFSTPVREAIDGQDYVAGINASDPDRDPITYQLITGPFGMTINPVTGLLRWNETAGKNGRTFTVVVGATDNINPAVTQTFQISVRAYNVYTGSAKVSTGSSSSNTSSGSGSFFDSIFGTSKPAGIVISNVNVISGPKNINDANAQNCNVYVNWATNVPTSGQVVYGTASQSNIANYNYPQSAAEGNSYAKTHQVKLGCLTNTATYYFRVVAFSDTDRAASAENAVYPVTVRIAMPGGVDTTVSQVTQEVSGAASSFWSSLSGIIFHPAVIVLVIIFLIGYVVLKYIRFSNLKAERIKAQRAAEAAAAAGAPGHNDHNEPGIQIPILSVPH